MRSLATVVFFLLLTVTFADAATTVENANILADRVIKQYITTPITAVDEIDSEWEQLILRAASEKDVQKQADAALPLQQAKAETARTDKQTGAPPSAAGTTSIVSKPGIPELLAFAIERGAVSKTTTGTTATLSTTPYAAVTLLGTADSADFYTYYGFLGRLGVSATFPITSSGDGSDNNMNEITSWALKLRLLGDRNPRSREFVNKWNKEVRPLIQDKLDAITTIESTIFNDSKNKAVNQEIQNKKLQTMNYVKEYLGKSKDNDATKREIISSVILTNLEPIVDRVRTLVFAQKNFAKNIFETDSINKKLQDIIDELAVSPLLTLEYIAQKNETSSDISELRLVYESRLPLTKVDFIANGIFSFYNETDSGSAQKKIKEYGATVTLEGKLKNGVWKNTTDPDMSMISIAGSGSFVRQNEGFNRGNMQLRIEIPIGKGVSLPLAVTYASRTETSDKSEVRANLGLLFDLQKLKALSQLM